MVYHFMVLKKIPKNEELPIKHVQYFNISGHVIKACPFYTETGFQNNYQVRKKLEPIENCEGIYCIDNKKYKIIFVFSPRLSKSKGLVNQVFTRPFSLAVQKVVQNMHYSSTHSSAFQYLHCGQCLRSPHYSYRRASTGFLLAALYD
jgi:hypothetical protein